MSAHWKDIGRSWEIILPHPSLGQPGLVRVFELLGSWSFFHETKLHSFQAGTVCAFPKAKQQRRACSLAGHLLPEGKRITGSGSKQGTALCALYLGPYGSLKRSSMPLEQRLCVSSCEMRGGNKILYNRHSNPNWHPQSLKCSTFYIARKTEEPFTSCLGGRSWLFSSQPQPFAHRERL